MGDLGMQTITNIGNVKINNKKVTIPETLKPNKITYTNSEAIDFMNFISSQHPLINVWLVFSLISIGILSVLLYMI